MQITQVLHCCFSFVQASRVTYIAMSSANIEISFQFCAKYLCKLCKILVKIVQFVQIAQVLHCSFTFLCAGRAKWIAMSSANKEVSFQCCAKYLRKLCKLYKYCIALLCKLVVQSGLQCQPSSPPPWPWPASACMLSNEVQLMMMTTMMSTFFSMMTGAQTFHLGKHSFKKKRNFMKKFHKTGTPPPPVLLLWNPYSEIWPYFWYICISE